MTSKILGFQSILNFNLIEKNYFYFLIICTDVCLCVRAHEYRCSRRLRCQLPQELELQGVVSGQTQMLGIKFRCQPSSLATDGGLRMTKL